MLQQGCVLTNEDDVMLLGDHCLDVFVACDYQLPNYLAQRLTECNCALDDFFDYVFEMISETPQQFFSTAKRRIQ